MKVVSNALFSAAIAVIGLNESLPHHQWHELTLERTRLVMEVPQPESTTSYAQRFQAFQYRLSEGYGLHESRAARFSGWILEASQAYEVPKETIAAMIMTESSFRYEVVSSVGAVGPAQVRPRFWEDQCEGDIVNDARDNILCGAYILDEYRDRCDGDLTCALEKYNVGPTNWYSQDYEGSKKRYIANMDHYINLL